MIEVAIFKLLFPPNGSIPVERIDRIQDMRSHIATLLALAAGQHMPAKASLKRLSQPDVSQAATLRIVHLWKTPDEQGRRRTWAEVAAQVDMGISGNAARHRYDTYKSQQEGYDAISCATYTAPPEVQQKIEAVAAGTTPATEQPPASEIAATTEDGKSKEIEQVVSATAPPALPDGLPLGCERATIRESQIVEKVEEVKQPEPDRNKYGRYEAPVEPATDAEISHLDAEGKSCMEISAELAKKGIYLTWQRVRGRIAYMARARTTKHKATGPKISPSPSLPGVEGAPEEVARANLRGSPEENAERPAPKSIPRAELDAKIWKAWKAEKTLEQISEELCAEGLYYGKKSIELRLRQQGADL